MPGRARRHAVAWRSGGTRHDGRVILRATLVVLAGGDSRRMGQPKALLPVGSTTLIEWLTARLAPEFAHLVVAARGPERVPAGLRAHLVPDLHAGAGPLAGVEAGLAASPHDVVVAVACDMPAVTAGLLRRLVRASAGAGVDAAVPRIAGRPEPACAAYRRSAAGPIAAALGAGRRRAADALAGLRVRWLDGEDAAQFANLNTPDDYRRFLVEYASVLPTGQPPDAVCRDPA
jgi:molybdopterin-guanine dinucleotide biosynthesis protein A